MKDYRRISAKAVLLGVLVDIGGTIVVSLFYASIIGIILALQGVPGTEIEAKLTQGAAVYLSSLTIGCMCTFLGGYAAGHSAKTAESLNGGLVGVISVLIGLALYKPLNIGSYPMWHNIIGFTLAIPLAIIGGLAAKSTGDDT